MARNALPCYFWVACGLYFLHIPSTQRQTLSCRYVCVCESNRRGFAGMDATARKTVWNRMGRNGNRARFSSGGHCVQTVEVRTVFQAYGLTSESTPTINLRKNCYSRSQRQVE